MIVDELTLLVTRARFSPILKYNDHSGVKLPVSLSRTVAPSCLLFPSATRPAAYVCNLDLLVLKYECRC